MASSSTVAVAGDTYTQLMGEALGIALGTIALASLISTCVKLDDFELGKRYEYDYSLAYLKLSFVQS